jgi:predicted nucleotidyltransferase
MLETIITSKSLRTLLGVFFLNPDSKFYIRELERLTDLPVNAIRRELIKLEKGHFLNSSYEANLKYFRVNKSNVIFEQLRSILLKTQIPQVVFGPLKRVKEIKYAFIYGSFANNEDNINSDIDLMLLGDIDSVILHEKISIIEQKIKRVINYTIEDLDKIKKTKSSFIRRVLEDKKIFIIGQENEFRRFIEEK